MGLNGSKRRVKSSKKKAEKLADEIGQTGGIQTRNKSKKTKVLKKVDVDPLNIIFLLRSSIPWLKM